MTGKHATAEEIRLPMEENQSWKSLAENSGSDVVPDSTVGKISEVGISSTERESKSSPSRRLELPEPYGLGTYPGQDNRLGVWLNVLESTDILPSNAHDLGATIEFKDRLRGLARERLSELQIRNIVDAAKQFAGFKNEALGFEHLYQALDGYKWGKDGKDTGDKTLETKRSTQSEVLTTNPWTGNMISKPQQSWQPHEISTRGETSEQSEKIFACQRPFCAKFYTDPEEDCHYHPGTRVFDEEKTGWSCCKARVLKYDKFYTIPPCTTGKHATVVPGFRRNIEENRDSSTDMLPFAEFFLSWTTIQPEATKTPKFEHPTPSDERGNPDMPSESSSGKLLEVILPSTGKGPQNDESRINRRRRVILQSTNGPR